MKNWLKCIVGIKTNACIMFTGCVLAFVLIYGILEDWMIPGSMILELALVCLLCSIVQFVFFFRRYHSSLELLEANDLLPSRLLAAVMGIAVPFGWFPTEKIGSWVTFFVIFALMFLGCAIGFEIYFRIMGRKYDDFLEEYKRNANTK